MDPSKILERRQSHERVPAAHRLLEESSLLPSQNLAYAPRVPPRRKKSAPPDFHLEVLQSSDSLYLKGLTFNSNNNNNPSEYSPVMQDSGTLPFSPSESNSSSSVAAFSSTGGCGSKLQRPTSLELIAGLHAPPPLNQEQFLDNDFLTRNTSLLDLEADFSGCQSVTPQLPISPTHISKDLKLSSPQDFSHWVTFGENRNSGTISQGSSELLSLKQNQNTQADTGSNLKL